MSTDIITITSPKMSPINRFPSGSDSPTSHQDIQVLKRLTKGKFPTYLASSKSTSQTFAMKVFSDSVEDSDELYHNEVRFASLSHPNIINVVDYDKNRLLAQEGIYMRLTYVLSEYAPYGDFFDFIVKYKAQVDERLVRTYFRQLVDGVQYLHSLGVAHLDLKPENLLIGADFNLKIIDFDLSYVTGDEKVLGRGTKYYRAPELYSNISSSSENHVEMPFAADIYSMGIILFILKSGGVYPHAENRVIDDTNFTELMHKNHRRFWSKHCKIQGREKSFFDSKFKSLFHKMVKADPKKRPSMEKIKQSKWYNGPVYTRDELVLRMKSILHCY